MKRPDSGTAKPITDLEKEPHKTFIFPEAIFTAVTAYQNQLVSVSPFSFSLSLSTPFRSFHAFSYIFLARTTLGTSRPPFSPLEPINYSERSDRPAKLQRSRAIVHLSSLRSLWKHENVVSRYRILRQSFRSDRLVCGPARGRSHSSGVAMPRDAIFATTFLPPCSLRFATRSEFR